MKAREVIQNLGFSRDESRIYLTLLGRGPLLISHIAHHTGMHRPTVYRALPILQARGLVSVVASGGKQNRYVAENPEKLRSLFDYYNKNFEKLLGDLQETYAAKKNKPLIKFLEGRRGLAFVASDLLATLKRGDAYYVYTTKRASIITNKYLPKSFHRGRLTKQIERFVITDELADFQKKSDLTLAVKIIPTKYDFINDKITQVIYGDKVAVTDFEANNGFIIENAMFAQLQKKFFKALYELL